jgi:hypothetical protein
MFEGGRSFAIRFIETLKIGQFGPSRAETVPCDRKGVEFYTNGLGGCCKHFPRENAGSAGNGSFTIEKRFPALP